MQNMIYRLSDYIEAGGPVMVPLLILSVIMWFLIINRTIYMRRLFYKNMPRRKAGEFVKMDRTPEAGFQGVNALLVREFLSKRSHDPETDAYILDETVMNLVSAMDRYLAVITVLSGVAPLMGLLGTVTGMITTFDVITVFGTGNANAMAGGISEALITTQTGLLVSIPGLYMSGFLNKRSANLKNRIAATGIYLKRYLE